MESSQESVLVRTVHGLGHTRSGTSLSPVPLQRFLGSELEFAPRIIAKPSLKYVEKSGARPGEARTAKLGREPATCRSLIFLHPVSVRSSSRFGGRLQMTTDFLAQGDPRSATLDDLQAHILADFRLTVTKSNS